MALRDQPYIPLYVQDIMTDEKLNECCAATHGIYIKGIMCLMHKSKTYGKILLKQSLKQNPRFSQSKNISKEKIFACMLAKHLPYTEIEIEVALEELIREDVCQFEDDFLVQKRMVKDGYISEIRSKGGKNGGQKTQQKNKDFATDFAKAKVEAKVEASSEYEYEYNNSLIINNVDSIIGEFEQKKIEDMVVLEMMKIWMKHNPKYFEDKQNDYSACLSIGYKVARMKKWKEQEILNGKMNDCLASWEKIVIFIKSDNFLKTLALANLDNQFQMIVQKMTNPIEQKTITEEKKQPKIKL